MPSAGPAARAGSTATPGATRSTPGPTPRGRHASQPGRRGHDDEIALLLAAPTSLPRRRKGGTGVRRLPPRQTLPAAADEPGELRRGTRGRLGGHGGDPEGWVDRAHSLRRRRVSPVLVVAQDAPRRLAPAEGIHRVRLLAPGIVVGIVEDVGVNLGIPAVLVVIQPV